MSKLCVLKLNTEFRGAYYRGKSFVHPLLIAYVRKNRFGIPRFGITTGKKLGKAVKRNRCRRLIREAYRQLAPEITGGFDMVFVARAATVESREPKVEKAMRDLLKKAGVIA